MEVPYVSVKEVGNKERRPGRLSLRERRCCKRYSKTTTANLHRLMTYRRMQKRVISRIYETTVKYGLFSNNTSYTRSLSGTAWKNFQYDSSCRIVEYLALTRHRQQPLLHGSKLLSTRLKCSTVGSLLKFSFPGHCLTSTFSQCQCTTCLLLRREPIYAYVVFGLLRVCRCSSPRSLFQDDNSSTEIRSSSLLPFSVEPKDILNQAEIHENLGWRSLINPIGHTRRSLGVFTSQVRFEWM